jgi:YggT family protein
VFVLHHFFSALAWLIDYVLTAYMWLIIIRALLSWVNPDPYNVIVRFIYRATEPVLRPLRDLLPTYRIGLDISPMIAILAILFLQRFLVPVLFEIAGRVT